MQERNKEVIGSAQEQKEWGGGWEELTRQEREPHRTAEGLGSDQEHAQ